MSKVNVSAVWDRSTEFLGDNIAAVMTIALPFIYLPQLVQNALQPLATSSTGGWIVQLVTLAMVIVGLWGQLQVMALALDPARSVAQAREMATARLIPVIIVSLCLLLGVLALMIPVLVALVAAGLDYDAMERAITTGATVPVPTGLTASLALFILLYCIALLVVMLWVGVRLLVANAVIVEERRMLGAMPRSFAMTRGHTLVLIGLALLYGVVSFVAVAAAQSVFGFVIGLILGGEGPITVATVLTAAIVAAVATAFGLLITSFVAYFYRAVRAHENADAA
ncbi:MAG: hypothetical protein C0476_01370 [Sphingomonas sp.]|nr:hypothetical protein [Sphingomonas sp.]